MAELQHSGHVLIVSSGEKSAKAIASMIRPNLRQTVHFEKTGGGTRRKAEGRRYDVIIINAPLSDEFGNELAVDLAKVTTSGILLLVKSDVAAEVSDLVEESGVLTLAKPLSEQIFFQAMRAASASSARVQRWESENRKLREKLEETRAVGRAKCLLVQYQGMTEEEAHRHIEKRAMDERVTRRLVAEEILRLY